MLACLPMIGEGNTRQSEMRACVRETSCSSSWERENAPASAVFNSIPLYHTMPLRMCEISPPQCIYPLTFIRDHDSWISHFPTVCCSFSTFECWNLRGEVSRVSPPCVPLPFLYSLASLLAVGTDFSHCGRPARSTNNRISRWPG